MTKYSAFKEELRENYQGPFIATDIIIRHNNGKKEGIVLIERKYSPLGLALPGGIAERMHLHENAVKEAKEETGLDIILDEPLHRPFCLLSDPQQDPRAFIASVTFTAQGNGTLRPYPDEDAQWAGLFTLEEITQLLPDETRWAFPNHHRKILEIYLEEKSYVQK